LFDFSALALAFLQPVTRKVLLADSCYVKSISHKKFAD